MTSVIDRERDSHALVRFLEEDSTSIVPLWRIEDKENLEYGGSCRVVWSNKKVYKAFLICTGSQERCAETQEELEESECDDNKEIPNKRNRQDAGEKSEGALKPKKTRVSSANKAKKAPKAKASKKKGIHGSEKQCTAGEKKKNSESDFVIHVGAAPPSSSTPVPPSTTLESSSTPVPPLTTLRSSSAALPQPQLITSQSSAVLASTSSQNYHTEEIEDPYSSCSEVDEISEDDETTRSVYRVAVTGSPPNRTSGPIHYFTSSRQRITEQIDKLKEDVKKHNEEQKAWMEMKFNEIQKELKLLAASGIARTLSAVFGQSSSSLTPSRLHVTRTSTTESPATMIVTTSVTSPVVTTSVTSPVVTTSVTSPVVTTSVTSPVVTTSVTSPVASSVSTSNADGHAGDPESSDIPVADLVGAEINVESDELLSHSDLVPFFRKGRNRAHFAALLVEELVDEETRVRSNVRGRGKEKLDPAVIEWVKKKSFQYYPTEGNMKLEWEKCITAIDSKNRSIKRKQAFKPIN